MATAADQINGALRLLGVIAEGETPSASTSQDSLTALNQMIDSWSTERLSVFCTQDQSFTWPADTDSVTFGPTPNPGSLGTFVRPVLVDDATYFVDSSGVSRPITLINVQQYNAISLKTTTANYPQLMWVNMWMEANENIELTVYPVPDTAFTMHIVSVLALTQPAALGTTLYLPPGYLRAFKFNLAMEIAPEVGVEPSAQVKRIAMVSKRNIKRINKPDDLLSLPTALFGNRSRYNIFAGDR